MRRVGIAVAPVLTPIRISGHAPWYSADLAGV